MVEEEEGEEEGGRGRGGVEWRESRARRTSRATIRSISSAEGSGEEEEEEGGGGGGGGGGGTELVVGVLVLV